MLWLLLACASSTVSGCALLFENDPVQVTQQTQVPAPPTRDSVLLDIVLAQRAGEDSLMDLLWDSVDEIGAMSMAVTDQRNLRASGFRVGVTGSPPPPALQTILRESIDREMGEVQSWRPSADQLPGSSRVALPLGQDTLFEISHGADLTFTPIAEDGERDDTKQTYQNARCLVRVSAEKIQDGWLRLKFLPEVHHGAHKNRPTVGENGLQFKSTQLIEPLYDYQFEVTLNPGEIAIVGRNGNAEERPGYQFFSFESENGPMQKLITVRFLETSTVSGVRQSTSGSSLTGMR